MWLVRLKKKKTLVLKCFQEEGSRGGGADTLTDWLKSANTRCCLQPRLARGLGQHNLCVLDNTPASQQQQRPWLQFDSTAPQRQRIYFYWISLKATSSHLRSCSWTREPSIHGNPSQVQWFTCNSGNWRYNEKCAYKVSGIQMQHVLCCLYSYFSLPLKDDNSSAAYIYSSPHCSPTAWLTASAFLYFFFFFW